jgi:hypothetical protein
MRLFAQGDLLIETVDDCPPSGDIVEPSSEGATVLAHGELSGHRHVIHARVTLFRDDSLARDIPPGLYVGHVKVDSAQVALEHEEHAPISLTKGTYRVRRQRYLEPTDSAVLED